MDVDKCIPKSTLTPLLECPLCLSMICEPISISCGHTFCRVCLTKSLRIHKKRCPTCRDPCHISPETAPENVMIKGVLMTLDSEGYKARVDETKAEKESLSAVYPIFFYNSAMFPGSKLNLHLYEPRYKTMMTRVLNSGKSFAYVPHYTYYRASNGDVALMAKVKEAEFLPDGRCVLEATLSGRYRITDNYVEEGTQGLHYCRLEELRDAPLNSTIETLDAAIQLAEQAKELASFVIEATTTLALVEKQFGAMPPSNSFEAFSLWLAAVCPFPEQEKYTLLTTTDTLLRLRKCVSGLEAYCVQLNTKKKAALMITAAGTSVVNATSSLSNILSNFIHCRNPPGGDNRQDTGDTAVMHFQNHLFRNQNNSPSQQQFY